MSSETMEEFKRLNGNCLGIPNEGNAIAGQPPVPVHKQVLITTHYLGGNEPYKLVAERYGVCKATAYHIVLHVSQDLVDNYVDRFIKWPAGQAAPKCYGKI